MKAMTVTQRRIMSSLNSENGTQAEGTLPFNPLPSDAAKIRTHEGKARKGRPVGSTIFDRASFERHSVEFYAGQLRRGIQRIRQDDVALKLGISRHTFMGYLRRYEISWSQIQELARSASSQEEECICKWRDK
jgi:predicted DNA-binding protein (UPF0251 family)